MKPRLPLKALLASGSIMVQGCGHAKAGVERGDASTPADGAFTLAVQPPSTQSCPAARMHGQISRPLRDPDIVYQALTDCDTSQGCKPDQVVAVDGVDGARVFCDVHDFGGMFAVSASFEVQGPAERGGSVHFEVNGQVSASGGMLTIQEQDSFINGSDGSCSATIVPGHGFVKQGGIWAAFECGGFSNPTDISGGVCSLKGAFLVDGCQE